MFPAYRPTPQIENHKGLIISTCTELFSTRNISCVYYSVLYLCTRSMKSSSYSNSFQVIVRTEQTTHDFSFLANYFSCEVSCHKLSIFGLTLPKRNYLILWKKYLVFKGYFKIVTKRQSVISVYCKLNEAAGWPPIEKINLFDAVSLTANDRFLTIESSSFIALHKSLHQKFFSDDK